MKLLSFDWIFLSPLYTPWSTLMLVTISSTFLLKNSAKHSALSSLPTIFLLNFIQLGNDDLPISFAAFTAFQSDLQFPGITDLLILSLRFAKKCIRISLFSDFILLLSSFEGFLLKLHSNLFRQLILLLITGHLISHDIFSVHFIIGATLSITLIIFSSNKFHTSWTVSAFIFHSTRDSS